MYHHYYVTSWAWQNIEEACYITIEKIAILNKNAGVGII